MDPRLIEEKLAALRRCVARVTEVDWSIVHRIAHEHVDDFAAFAKAISALLAT